MIRQESFIHGKPFAEVLLPVPFGVMTNTATEEEVDSSGLTLGHRALIVRQESVLLLLPPWQEDLARKWAIR